jgi:hypothetical protein
VTHEERRLFRRIVGRSSRALNRRLGVPTADLASACGSRRRELRLDRVCRFKYRRPEVHVRLNGRIVAFDAVRELVVSPALSDASADQVATTVAPGAA